MVFTKLLLENALAIRPCNCEAALEPLLPKVARCIPVLPSRYYQKNRSANVEKILDPLPVVTTSRRFCWSAQLGFSFTNHCFDNRTPAWRII